MSTFISSAVKVTLAAAVAVGSTALVAAPAQAKGGGDGAVSARGVCAGGGTWKLKAKHDDGVVKYEFEVDTNKVGQVWNVTVTDNGVTAFSGQKTTVAPSGSFSLEKTTTDRAGKDLVKAKATRGSASCSGSVSV